MFHGACCVRQAFYASAEFSIDGGSGMKEEMIFHLSVCSPALLLAGDAVVVSEEVEHFIGLLTDLNRVTAVEKKRMDRSFPLFLERFRSLATSVSIDGAGSAVEIDSGPSL